MFIECPLQCTVQHCIINGSGDTNQRCPQQRTKKNTGSLFLGAYKEETG